MANDTKTPAPYVRTQTWPGVENLCFASMKLGFHYTLTDISEEQHELAKKAGEEEAARRGGYRLHVFPQTSPFSRDYTYGFVKIHRDVVIPPGMEGMLIKQVGGAGRPLGPTGEAVQILKIDEHVFIRRDGRVLQGIRNTISRIGKRLNRKYRTELYEHGDVIKVIRTE